MSPLRRRLERYFEFQTLGTNWKTELLAGATTFITMAYIVFVNPSILHEAGMPLPAVVAATCISAAAGSLLMGAYARYPIALAPGMGLNAYFTYSVVKGMGVPWQSALGAVFLSGVAFLVLTLVGVRQLIVSAIPQELYAAVAAGVGLFIAFIGFRNAGIIVPHPATTVTLGNLAAPNTLLAVFGLLLIAALLAWRVRAAMLIGILATTLAGAACGLVRWQPQTYHLSDISATAFKLDVASILKIGLVEIVFVFLFVDLFDNIGTLVAVGKKAELFGADHQIPRINRILVSDACASIVGSLTGTSTVVSYIESSAGVAAGGRTGVTAIVTGALFVVGAVRRAAGGRDSRGGHSAGADHCGRPDGVDGERDSVVGSAGGGACLSDDDDHSAEFFHRQRPRIRLHGLHAAAGAARPVSPGERRDVRADRAVSAALLLHAA